jgi:hypothetical protein
MTMPLAVGLADVRADLDGLRARLDTMVAAAGGARPVIPPPRASAVSEGEPLLRTGVIQQELTGRDVARARARTLPGTATTIVQGLELPALARRRFRADSGCVLADVGKKSPPGGELAARHPAAKVSALWRADLADDFAWSYEYESRAWGYASMRWLLVDAGAAAGSLEQRSATGAKVGLGDVARLCAATGQTAEAARQSGPGQARQALVRLLSADAGRLLQGRCGARVNRELLEVTAEATLLAGYLTYACWPRAALAQAYFVQALALAQACGDRQLGAAILCAMSQQAVCNGRLDEGRNLVSAAVSGLRDAAPPELSAHLRLLAARDHMHRNELTSCVRALKETVTEFDGVLQDGKQGWTRWLTEADPLLFALLLAAACLAAGLPGPARDTQLIAEQLADRIQSPCSARYVSELEHHAPPAARLPAEQIVTGLADRPLEPRLPRWQYLEDASLFAGHHRFGFRQHRAAQGPCPWSCRADRVRRLRRYVH